MIMVISRSVANACDSQQTTHSGDVVSMWSPRTFNSDAINLQRE